MVATISCNVYGVGSPAVMLPSHPLETWGIAIQQRVILIQQRYPGPLKYVHVAGYTGIGPPPPSPPFSLKSS